MRQPVGRLILMAAVVLAAVAADQSTKHLARAALRGAGTVRVAGDFFVLRYAENTGAFLSLGSAWPPLWRAAVFGIFSLAVVAAAAVYAIRQADLSRFQTAALALVIGGGAGNLIDRLARGGLVTDFMNVGIGALRTGIFNLADLFLMAGALMLALGLRPRPES